MYVSAVSARGVLRNIVREATSKTPTEAHIVKKFTALMRVHHVESRRLVALCQSIVKGHALCQFIDMKNRSNVSWVAIVPYFHEIELGWEMHLSGFEFVKTDYGNRISNSSIRMAISGHALERFFQRGMAVNWEAVKKEIASMLPDVGLYSYAPTFKQVVFTSNSGYFVGEVHYEEDGTHGFEVKTFLRRSKKCKRVRDFLDAVKKETPITHSEAYFTLCGQKEAAVSSKMQVLLAIEPWLGTPYDSGSETVD